MRIIVLLLSIIAYVYNGLRFSDIVILNKLSQYPLWKKNQINLEISKVQNPDRE